ncbi:MAG: hypothetical protein N2Z58_09400 [Fervidobacterium sp.]|nr:hypothetical protein [Fervidobacterium sp.]
MLEFLLGILVVPVLIALLEKITPTKTTAVIIGFLEKIFKNQAMRNSIENLIGTKIIAFGLSLITYETDETEIKRLCEQIEKANTGLKNYFTKQKGVS